MVNKMFFISEALSTPFDEGIKNVVVSLHRELEAKKNILAVTNTKNNVGDLKIVKIGLNKLFLNNKLRVILRDYSPDIILYIPFNSCSFYSFMKTKTLKMMYRKAKVVMIGLVHKDYSFIQDAMIKNYFKPDLLLLLGQSDVDYYVKKGMKVKILPPAVDNIKFSPANDKEKERIRAEYNIPNNKTVVLHVGHINIYRNIERLIELQKVDKVQVVIVGSTTTKVDNNLKDGLVRGGVRVINGYIPDISKVYKMSDIYVFPVIKKTAAIEMPLSVLEALACNLPVITTRFGGLIDHFEEDSGFRYFDTTEELVELVRNMNKEAFNNNNKLERFTWAGFADEVITACEEIV